MHKLEGFQYETELETNKKYYTIRIFPNSQDMPTIVTEFGRFNNNPLPTGMCASGDIFQEKIDEILSDIKVVRHISMIYLSYARIAFKST